MKTKWQDYENIEFIPENAAKVELILSKEKPAKSVKGFIMTTPFTYNKTIDGSKLWVRFLTR